MSLAMAGLQAEEVAIYLDDFMIFGKDLEEHAKRFKRVMQRLVEANLTIEPKKCQFLEREAAVLGHIARGGCIRTDPKKDFAKIAKPLYDLLSKNVKFHWDEEQQAAFDKLKEILCSEAVLAAPDLFQPFIVTCDASDYGLGAVIGQGKIGQDRPCAYASRPLKGSELRYSTHDKELLAIVFAKEHFRYWLYGRKFTVVTDHEPLKHFHSTKKSGLFPPIHSTPKSPPEELQQEKTNNLSLQHDTPNNAHPNQTLPEIAMKIHAKLRVNIKEKDHNGKNGIQVDIWETDSQSR
ncbi:hypothetical protein TSAR_006329 [Trichomalopsis sarcophagae]|uniref:Reverse transcriptase domain-containing protein n=1 Tax=Trichomalopsis sarcophagae TaxID=543379 RepID=A0A232EJ99_9HYME|nr:hypothetical protein TSAR_006329 [Trichomalopsis sarcophagae]